MDEVYKHIKDLSDLHIALCTFFIQALNEDKPAEELAALKEQIKQVITDIEVLEHKRNSNATL